MGEFFKSWRRKFGVVTLAMACVFAGGWIRSQSSHDMFHILYGSHEWYVKTNSGHICFDWFQYDWNNKHMMRPTPNVPFWEAIDKSSRDYQFLQKGFVSGPWDREFCGIRIARTRADSVIKNPTYLFMAAPFWSLTIPLTALSAFLLLSKPRKSKPKKITEPKPVEAA